MTVRFWLAASLLVWTSEAWAAKAPKVDTKPPKITHVAVDRAETEMALTLTAKIADESEIFEPTVYYRLAGSTKFLTLRMKNERGAMFIATIPGPEVTGDIEYFIEAYDVHGNGPSRYASNEVPHKISVPAKPAPAVDDTPKANPSEPETASSKPEPVPEPIVAPASPPPEQEKKVVAQEPLVKSAPFFGPLRIAGVSVGAVGIAGLVVGAVLGTRANSLRGDAQADRNASTAASKYNSAQSSATGANVCFFAGGALTAAGIVLAILPSFIGHASSPESGLFVGPSGVAYSGTF
jgi:hypothetical protein